MMVTGVKVQFQSKAINEISLTNKIEYFPAVFTVKMGAPISQERPTTQ